MIRFNSAFRLAAGTSPQVATAAWLAGTSGAMVLQAAFARRFAADTAWGYNGGWQREIAVWNLGTIVAGAGIVAQGPESARAQLRGLMVLSALFGANHLAAGIRSPRSRSHWVGAAANGVGLAIGLPVLLRDARRPAAH